MNTRQIGRASLAAIAFVLIGLALSSTASAQPAAHTAPQAGRHAADLNCDSLGLSPAVYRRVLHERFAALYSAKPNNVPGSFAALDIKDAEATFANTAVFASGAVMDVRARGGVAEGVLPILNNQDVNGKLGLDVQFHRLRRGWTALEYTNASCVAYKAALLKATNDSVLTAFEVEKNYQQVLKNVELDRLARKKSELQRIIDTTSVPSFKDSLVIEQSRTDALAQQVRDRQVPSREAQLDAARVKAAAARRAARSLLAIRGHTFSWWSIAYGLSNTTFRLFDPAAAYASQITKDSYASQSVGVSFSRYQLTSAAGESNFFTVGVRGGLSDNLSSLTKVDLTETTNYGPNPNDRVGTTKFTGYRGAYKKNVGTATLSADYYTFFLFRNQGAIHLYPAVTLKEGERPTYAAGAGLLVVARKDEKSVLNAELYFNLTDLTNASDADAGFIGRSGLGLRFTFPITFGSME